MVLNNREPREEAMPKAPMMEPLSSPQVSSPMVVGPCSRSRFLDLRGVRWRMDLGILPNSSDSVGGLRRAAADSRRRYVNLRRRLLVEPPKDGIRTPNLTLDNPLSQSPDSIWSRFFRNAELEKMLDQDLSRLYPENGTYFQTPACQSMLRRILLLWCLKHPGYGYRQGMHELLAPLLYVLHVDLQHLSQVQEFYEDHFDDDFDGMSSPEDHLIFQDRSKEATNGVTTKGNGPPGGLANRLEELEPEIRDIFLLSDPYGAEGELGAILSGRFMEHDAYCMFDSLMNGAGGAVAMADLFSSSHASGSSTGLPPVIEASSALYHLLSIVDPSLYSHLVELGVEPQYFALRWLRVLFGREFSLEDLLLIWDEIFSSPNSTSVLGFEDDEESNCRLLCCRRGAFIAAMAVSMLLHLRSSLLATENATTCLQRLLNFPESANIKKLIEKAKSMQALALDVAISSPSSNRDSSMKKLGIPRGRSLSFGSASPKTPLYAFPDSYWEDKWRVLHRAEELRTGSPRGSPKESIPKGTMKVLQSESYSMVRKAPASSQEKVVIGKADAMSTVRHMISADLPMNTDSAATTRSLGHDAICELLSDEKTVSKDVGVRQGCSTEPADRIILEADSNSLIAGNSSEFLIAASSLTASNDHEIDSARSSVTSDSSLAYNDDQTDDMEELHRDNLDGAVFEHLDGTTATTMKVGQVADGEILEKRYPEAQRGKSGVPIPGECGDSCGKNKNTKTNLKTLGQSILDNIQVIDSALQQRNGKIDSSADNLTSEAVGGNAQLAAMAALQELKRISNLLSEL